MSNYRPPDANLSVHGQRRNPTPPPLRRNWPPEDPRHFNNVDPFPRVAPARPPSNGFHPQRPTLLRNALHRLNRTVPPNGHPVPGRSPPSQRKYKPGSPRPPNRRPAVCRRVPAPKPTSPLIPAPRSPPRLPKPTAVRPTQTGLPVLTRPVRSPTVPIPTNPVRAVASPRPTRSVT
ncbi:hypothetical protein Ari01nite_39060 [Paractinoplanes rishiriensis]|uniref:Uncharacterized protein n=1 Tax=Paractinoplanes rishiriensis TaxID=1050105 RepID=A0A919MQS0_9ACTN|nr:hypothetical protein Ari01nite_39060 [Actinoplanes rishiriensis]